MRLRWPTQCIRRNWHKAYVYQATNNDSQNFSDQCCSNSDMGPGGLAKMVIKVGKLSSSKWTKCPGTKGACCLTIYVWIIFLHNNEYWLQFHLQTIHGIPTRYQWLEVRIELTYLIQKQWQVDCGNNWAWGQWQIRLMTSRYSKHGIKGVAPCAHISFHRH